MNAGRDVERLLSDWLVEEAPSGAPDRIVLAASDRIDHTRQRRFGAAWRFPGMNTPFRVAAAAAIGVLLLGGAIYLFGGRGEPDIGAPATPTPFLTPSPMPLPASGTGLQPGTYVTQPDPVVPLPITFTVPAGWMNSGWAIEKIDPENPVLDGRISVVFGTATDSYGDPCRWRSTTIDPPLGPAVQDLVAALEAQAGRNATAPSPVTLDGRAAQRLEFDWPSDADPFNCDGGEYRAWTGVGDASRANTMGRHSAVWIVDVDGLRVIVEVVEPVGMSDASRAETEAIVKSVRFGPSSLEPTPATSP